MYPSLRTTAVIESGAAPPGDPGDAHRGWVTSNVVYLGLTSLFTDISSEMVTAILPVYLVFQLRFTPLQFGLFNGIYLNAAASAFAGRRRGWSSSRFRWRP